MRLIESKAVAKALKKHREATRWVSQWRQAVGVAEWDSIGDVRKSYPSADGVKNKFAVVITVFNVKGNEYRLLTVIHYPTHTVYEVDLLSHEEYDLENWKEWRI